MEAINNLRFTFEIVEAIMKIFLKIWQNLRDRNTKKWENEN